MTQQFREEVVQKARAAGIWIGYANDYEYFKSVICKSKTFIDFVIAARADLVAENERLREQIKCGHSMELDSLARERDELLVENERLKLVQESALKVCAQLDEVVCALPLDYLDLPDGGDVSLGEQVSRMYSEVKSLRHECVQSRTDLAAAEADNERLRKFVDEVAKQTPEKPDYWSSCSQCGHNSSDAEDLIAQPRDDSALREMIAGVYEECAKVCEDIDAINSRGWGDVLAKRIRALAEKARK